MSESTEQATNVPILSEAVRFFGQCFNPPSTASSEEISPPRLTSSDPIYTSLFGGILESFGKKKEPGLTAINGGASAQSSDGSESWGFTSTQPAIAPNPTVDIETLSVRNRTIKCPLSNQAESHLPLNHQVKELRDLIKRAGLSTDACFERSDLISEARLV